MAYNEECIVEDADDIAKMVRTILSTHNAAIVLSDGLNDRKAGDNAENILKEYASSVGDMVSSLIAIVDAKESHLGEYVSRIGNSLKDDLDAFYLKHRGEKFYTPEERLAA